MSIVTKKGDRGYTSLLYGQKVPKNHTRIQAVGALDALNVEIGSIKILLQSEGARTFLESIQKELVGIMGEVTVDEESQERYESSKFHKLPESALLLLEEQITLIESQLPSFEGWATPGYSALEISIERARVTARAAERALITVHLHASAVRDLLMKYINRLSDYLWLMARQTANQHGR